MIHSMTGFGKAVLALPDSKITIEVRSLNSKNLDINSRVPQYLKEHDLSFRNQIRQTLQRGKIDLQIQKENISDDCLSASISQKAVQNYINQLKNITPDVEASTLLGIAMGMPDTLQKNKEEITDQELESVRDCLGQALHKLLVFREEEGTQLSKDFEKRVAYIQDYLKQLIDIDPLRIEQIKERLQTKLQSLQISDVDQNRFEQELIYYLERLDITEEKVRLSNHLFYFLETLESGISSGKKLGFISQEIGREINTIGSKVNNASMQKIVVQMKDELEKIKEQLLNVL